MAIAYRPHQRVLTMLDPASGRSLDIEVQPRGTVVIAIVEQDGSSKTFTLSRGEAREVRSIFNLPYKDLYE